MKTDRATPWPFSSYFYKVIEEPKTCVTRVFGALGPSDATVQSTDLMGSIMNREGLWGFFLFSDMFRLLDIFPFWIQFIIFFFHSCCFLLPNIYLLLDSFLLPYILFLSHICFLLDSCLLSDIIFLFFFLSDVFLLFGCLSFSHVNGVSM